MLLVLDTVGIRFFSTHSCRRSLVQLGLVGVLRRCSSKLHDETGEVVDQELGEDLKVVSAILDYLVPHVHNQQLIIVINKSLTNLIQLGKELKALVVD